MSQRRNGTQSNDLWEDLDASACFPHGSAMSQLFSIRYILVKIINYSNTQLWSVNNHVLTDTDRMKNHVEATHTEGCKQSYR